MKYKVNNLISFIIPTYNSVDYLPMCISSILDQGLETYEYEVIIINDGSTDTTENFCRQCCDKYPNFKLISTKNQGVGNARNEGIKHANGQYFMFIDSDDRLLKYGIKHLIEKYVEPYDYPDLISFHSRIVDRYYDESEWEVMRPDKLVFYGSFYEYAQQYGVGNSIWTNLISSQLIKDNNLLFSNHIMGEDMLFMLRLLMVKNSVLVASNLNIYRYYVRKGSIINNTNSYHLQKVYISLLDLYNTLLEIRAQSKINKTIINADLDKCRRWAFTRLCSAGLKYKELRKFLKLSCKKNLFNNKENPNLINLIILILSSSSMLFYTFSIFYRKIFMIFFKSYIKRN